MTLAFGEIIKELVNCLLVGWDSRGLHVALNLTGDKSIADLGLETEGIAIIKGAQGATSTATISTFTAGFVLVLITLFVVLNLKDSRAGRAIMALRDNSIAAESVGLNLTKYKLMAFVTSAALAGAAGALYGLNFSSLQASKFDFNTSILILVFVVLGGLGNIWGSLIAAAALTILPQALRLSIPGWANEFSILLKDSAVCYLLGTMEIMARVNAVAQRTHEHLAFFALAGVIYFVLTLIVLKLLRRLENKVQIPGYSAGTVGSMAKNTQHGVKNA